MRVVAFASQKGGSGKTTLSGHIAVSADLAGHGPVAIVDTDPQGSLSAWWNERPQPTPHYLRTTLEQLPEHLAQLEKAGVKLVVIDTPPAITTSIRTVIEHADHVVVPTRPSPHDLRAVGATVALIEDCGKPMVFVVNDATARAKVTAQAAVALSQHGTVAPVTIHHRTDFASSMIDGGTVMEHKPQSKSSCEVNALWEYLQSRVYDERWSTVIRRDDAIVDHPVKEPMRLDQTVVDPVAESAPPPQPTTMAISKSGITPVSPPEPYDLPSFDDDPFEPQDSPRLNAYKAIDEATRPNAPREATQSSGPVFGRRVG